MQVLTAQYPTLYTRKFRVLFTDFNSIANRSGTITLFTMPKANQIVFLSQYLETAFRGGPITDSFSTIHLSNNLPTAPATTQSLSVFRTFNAATDKNGVINAVPAVMSNSAPTNSQSSANLMAATGVSLRMTLPAGQLLTSLSQGSLLVWVTTMRQS